MPFYPFPLQYSGELQDYRVEKRLVELWAIANLLILKIIMKVQAKKIAQNSA
jgi:hypothetical protein